MEADERVGWSRAAQDAAEDNSPPAIAAEASQRHPSSVSVRPRLLVALSLLSLLFASAVAFGMWLYLANPDLCSVGTLKRGANIRCAVQLVALGGLAESVLLVFTYWRRRLLAAVLLLGAATLAAGLGLIALDSSTYVAGLTGFFIGPCRGTWTRHLAYLYFFWGAPLLLLLMQVIRLWVSAHRSTFSEPAHG
jgi:hypothetical protein